MLSLKDYVIQLHLSCFLWCLVCNFFFLDSSLVKLFVYLLSENNLIIKPMNIPVRDGKPIPENYIKGWLPINIVQKYPILVRISLLKLIRDYIHTRQFFASPPHHRFYFISRCSQRVTLFWRHTIEKAPKFTPYLIFFRIIRQLLLRVTIFNQGILSWSVTV